ncbi:hypothetical protein H4R33_006318, partial [Dimargaris cristalligena]
YAAAAYVDVTDWKCEPCKHLGRTDGTTIVHQFNKIHPYIRGYVARNESKNLMILAFSGSKEMFSYVTDLRLFKKYYPKAVKGSRVHTGFAESYQAGRS